MMKEFKKLIWIILPVLLMLGCTQEQFELREAPPEETDAVFTFEESTDGANYITFTTASSGFIKKWNFGNGTEAEGDVVTAYYPFEGSYDVTLTVFTNGGSASTMQAVEIDATDPEICNVEILQLLTGGCDAADGKTWVMDSDRVGYFGVGPNTNFFPEFYSAQPGEQDGFGFIDDEFTFILLNSVFTMETNGDVYVRTGTNSDFAGATENGGHFTAPYEGPEGLTYALSTNEAGDDFINISAPGFMGFYTGSRSYQVLEINENELYLRYNDLVDPFLVWYQRFIRKGYAPIVASFTSSTNGLEATFTNTSLNAETYSWDFGDGNTSTDENPVHTYTTDGTYTVELTASGFGEEEVVTAEVTVTSVPKVFPITFEDGDINFTGFGGSAPAVFNVIDNPDATGINTSARVGELVKGAPNWSGIELELDDNIDFTGETTLGMKVWSPVTGRALFKIEVVGDPGTFVEVFADITTTNEWEQLSFDFSAAATDTYGKIALFLDFDNDAGGTFYIDDIGGSVEPPATEITLDLLTGGNTKTWVLRDGAGSFGVGSGPGLDNFFPNGADISGDRPCLWNDEFVFKTGGQYEYITNGDIFGEGYMGLSDGCQTDANLTGTDAEDWGAGIHSFSLELASDTEDAEITVRGDGAFIVLPKAFNGGEYSAAPPTMDAAVTYQVLDYFKNSSGEELSLGIEVGGGTWWNFVLVPKE